MRKIAAFALAVALVAMPADPATAGWKLISNGETVKVAKGTMRVTPGKDWNRWSRRPIKKSEVWTLDGINLNEVYFVSGLVAGETLFRDRNKKEQPLPQMSDSLELTEIPEFVESSTRLSLGTSVFEMNSIEPSSLGGHQAVRFSYSYALSGSALQRRGLGVGTVVDGELYLVTYTAPEIYFFERDLPEFEAILTNLTF